MGCIYKIRIDYIYDEERRIHTVYGVEAWQGSEVVKTVPDIFSERTAAEKFVSLCNKCGLSECQLMEVVEDTLALSF